MSEDEARKPCPVCGFSRFARMDPDRWWRDVGSWHGDRPKPVGDCRCPWVGVDYGNGESRSVRAVVGGKNA